MKIKSVLNNVLERAAQSKPVQFFVRHSAKIAGALFAIGDGILIFKHHLHHGRLPNTGEQVSGGLLLLADAFLVAADRKPSMKVPAGIANLGGAVALGVAGMGDHGQNAQLVSSAVMGVQALALTFEAQAQKLAEKASSSGNWFLKKVFNPLAKYPVAATTVADLALSKSALLMAAIAKGDVGLMAVSATWVAADVALLANDNNVKKLFEKKEQGGGQKPSSPSSSDDPPTSATKPVAAPVPILKIA